VIASLLPASCATHETDRDLDVELYPEEAAAVANAVPRRRAEFATGRHCARQALAALGMPPAPLLPGHQRAPVWPAGIVGSLTHCDGYRAASVARGTDLRGIGIDAEPDLPLPDGVLATIAGGAEREHLADLVRHRPGPAWDRLMFCAKEAVYKVWSPLTGGWLGFHDVDLRLRPDGGFDVRLLVPDPNGTDANSTDAPLHQLTGRWAVADGVLLAACWLPR
jgi:4'-phosphopantetheinyl transferase EntD